MVIFEIETTVEVYSPKESKFKVKTTILIKIETIVEVHSRKHWEFRVRANIMFKVETTERNLKKQFLVSF